MTSMTEFLRLRTSEQEQKCIVAGVTLALQKGYKKPTQGDIDSLLPYCQDCMRRWKSSWQHRVNNLDGNNGKYIVWSKEKYFHHILLPTSNGIITDAGVSANDAKQEEFSLNIQEEIVNRLDDEYLGNSDNAEMKLQLLLQNLNEERDLRWIISNICYAKDYDSGPFSTDWYGIYEGHRLAISKLTMIINTLRNIDAIRKTIAQEEQERKEEEEKKEETRKEKQDSLNTILDNDLGFFIYIADADAGESNVNNFIQNRINDSAHRRDYHEKSNKFPEECLRNDLYGRHPQTNLLNPTVFERRKLLLDATNPSKKKTLRACFNYIDNIFATKDQRELLKKINEIKHYKNELKSELQKEYIYQRGTVGKYYPLQRILKEIKEQTNEQTNLKERVKADIFRWISKSFLFDDLPSSEKRSVRFGLIMLIDNNVHKILSDNNWDFNRAVKELQKLIINFYPTLEAEELRISPDDERKEGDGVMK